jgi:hypothetical protein
MQLTEIPRTILDVDLVLMRLPLTIVERVLGPQDEEDAEAWPPALAFDAFEANIKQVVGSIFDDPVLVEEGRILEARVDRLREAARLELAAQQKRAAADAKLDKRRRSNRARQEDAERRAREREEAARHRAEQRAREAEERAREKQDLSRRAKASTKRAVDAKAREARAARIEKEREAVARERKAARADAKVVDLDASIARSKAARTRAS